jgi:hypothetical protein
VFQKGRTSLALTVVAMSERKKEGKKNINSERKVLGYKARAFFKRV